MDVYVMKDGHRTGPFQPFRLREMVEEGTLMPGDVVWHEGMEDWQPLEKTESLRAVLDREEPATKNTPEEAEPAERTPPVPRLPPDPGELLAVLRTRRVLATRRFFARHIDMLFSGIVTVGVATQLGLVDLWSLLIPDNIYILLAPAVVWLLVEPVFLTIWGTTPGKALLGLRVEGADGGRLSLGQAYLRSVLVWAGGMGFGVGAGYILPMAQWVYSSWMLQRRGTTLWDNTARTVVRAGKLRRAHAIGLALAGAGYMALWLWLWLAAPVPDRLDPKLKEEIEKLRKEV